MNWGRTPIRLWCPFRLLALWTPSQIYTARHSVIMQWQPGFFSQRRRRQHQKVSPSVLMSHCHFEHFGKNMWLRKILGDPSGGSRILVRGALSPFCSKIGGFPFKLPENCRILKILGARGAGPQGPPRSASGSPLPGSVCKQSLWRPLTSSRLLQKWAWRISCSCAVLSSESEKTFFVRSSVMAA